jgi:hypothetical protein
VIERGVEVGDPRTEAPGFAPPTETSVPVRCLNCDALMSGRFCAECGQAASDPDPTLRELLRELAAELLLWDGKLLATFRRLVAKPGELTREYLAGRRVRYISPLKLYLTCSVIFFLLRSIVPAPTMVVRTGGVVKTQLGGIVLQEQQDGEVVKSMDRLAQSRTSRLRQIAGQRAGNALRHKQAFAAVLRENIPRMMFVLVPLFAALMALVFRARRMHYPKHLTFALHAHAFLFLALIPTLVPRIVARIAPQSTLGAALSAIAVLASFTAVALYLVLAIRRVYGGTLRSAVVRSAFLASAYFVCFTIALLATALIVMAVQF